MQSERKDKITEIKTMLDDMTDKQVENVHVYTAEEYKKPNHEAVALDAIIRLSKKYETEGDFAEGEPSEADPKED